jgi:hypothetical protein
VALCYRKPLFCDKTAQLYYYRRLLRTAPLLMLARRNSAISDTISPNIRRDNTTYDPSDLKAALDHISRVLRGREQGAFRPAAKRRAHHAASIPLLEAFFAWAEATERKFSTRSELAQALRYIITRRAALTRFATDARLEAGNNIAENDIHGIATRLSLCPFFNALGIDLALIARAIDFLAGDSPQVGAFANADGIYYGMWALRHGKWCPGDVWEEVLDYFVRFGVSGSQGFAKTFANEVTGIERLAPPLKVDSAFEGCCCYAPRQADDQRDERKSAPPGAGALYFLSARPAASAPPGAASQSQSGGC